jgi:hypothetical protein
VAGPKLSSSIVQWGDVDEEVRRVGWKKESEEGRNGAGPLNTVPLFHLGPISNSLVIILLVYIRQAVSHLRLRSLAILEASLFE